MVEMFAFESEWATKTVWNFPKKENVPEFLTNGKKRTRRRTRSSLLLKTFTTVSIV